MFTRSLKLGACLFALSGCAIPPLVTPSVRQTTDEFGQSMDDFTDKALLANVLRARDFAPLNFVELTNISGQSSFAETAGLNAPFGSVLGPGRNEATVGVAATSTPTVTLGTLNTQNFMATMLQPISSGYIASKWDEGHSHALLLYLFVKSIQFADDPAPRLNDPDHMAAFRPLIDQFLAQNVSLHSVELLDPVGAPLTFANNTTTGPGTQIQMGTSPAISALSLISGLNDGQLHAANAQCPDGSLGCAQIYKEYPATVAMCLPTILDSVDNQYKFAGHVIYSAPERGAFGSSRARAGLALLGATTAGITPVPTSSGSNGGGGGGGGGGPGGGSSPMGGGGQSSTTLGSMPELNAALASGRVSSILDSNDCVSDQIVLAPGADQALESTSPRAARIEWRSISEVIQYLGAIARNQNNLAAVPSWDDGQILFHVNHSRSGRISVDYLGEHYSVPGELAATKGNDAKNHSLEALGLLNELIGTAKESTDLPQL